MDIEQLCKYFRIKEITIRKAIKKMFEKRFENYIFLINIKVTPSDKGIE